MAPLFQDYSSIHCGDQCADLWQRVYQEQPTAAELLCMRLSSVPALLIGLQPSPVLA
jgi:hypothetical protein